MANPTEQAKIRALKWAVLKQHRSLPHALRRLYHLIMGLGCFSLYAWLIDRNTACWLLALIGGPFILMDILRLQHPGLKKLVLQYYGPLMRRNELLGLSGNSFFIAGMFTVVFFFSQPIALLSVLFLALGDPVAAFFGTRYGRIKIIGGKSAEGAFANFVASGIASAVFAAGYLGLSSDAVLTLGLVGGAVSTLAELVPFPVDDNFSVPVLSALQLALIDRLVPLF